MKFVRFLLTLLGLGVVFVGGFGYGRWYGTRPAASNARKVLYYVDAMHPWYKSDKPGIAPDCGMKLAPVYADGKPNIEPAHDSSHDKEIQITPEKQQLIGVRFGKVEWASISQPIQAAGKVMPDETSIARVQARTDGWIAKVFADYTGKRVEKGQPLLTLYSPDLLAAQQEYLLALRARTVMNHSSMHETAENTDGLIEASRRRLLLLNLSPEQITEVEQTHKAIENFTVYAPTGGVLMTRNAFPGQRVTAETELYTVADLSDVWVFADVFEADAQRIHLAQGAHVTIPGAGGSRFARVTNIQPAADAATRTVKVRLEMANADMKLHPDMYVDVEFDTGVGKVLSVPAEAVLDSGASKTVFVDRGNGYFDPREVETGVRSGDRIEIVKGLKAGDRIVTSGNFLLNSEAQMSQQLTRQPIDGGTHDQQHH
jgi:membrane fusion protein, copper/silver efflux system